MQSKTFSLRVDGAVADVEFTPAAAPGSTGALLDEEIRRLAAVLEDRPDVLCVLCSLGGSTRSNEGAAARGMRNGFRSVELLPQPVIAVIEGPCEGAVLELALACDLRIASSGATFAMPQVASGELPRLGGTQRLPRLVGRARAAQMILLGERVDAQTAQAWGLVNDVTPPGAARPRAAEIAASICARGPLAIRFAKEAMQRGLELPLDQALRYETDLTVILQTTADRAEGVRAFLEKRQPNFEGK